MSFGDINFFQSWVPIGSHLKTYSAPIIANTNDFMVLFRVAKKLFRYFLKV